jgi:hypothetical protein
VLSTTRQLSCNVLLPGNFINPFKGFQSGPGEVPVLKGDGLECSSLLVLLYSFSNLKSQITFVFFLFRVIPCVPWLQVFFWLRPKAALGFPKLNIILHVENRFAASGPRKQLARASPRRFRRSAGTGFNC